MSTIANVAKSAKIHHEIPLTLKDKEVVLHPPEDMKLGETVHYYSKVGEVEIKFVDNGSPFGSEKTEVTSKEPPLELKVTGDFKARCYITTPEGKFSYKTAVGGGEGGGNMHVS